MNGTPLSTLTALVALFALFALYALDLRWLGRMLDRLRRLPREADTRHGLLLFVAGGAAFVVMLPLLAWSVGIPTGDDAPPALVPSLIVQTVAALVGAGVVLLVAARLPDGLAGLGLRRHVGPPAPLVGLAAWIGFLPVFLAVGALSVVVLRALGHEPEPQHYIQTFLDDASARSSVFVWLAIAVINPLAEELAFRGALFGGLRARLPVPVAMFVSAVLFAALHEIDVGLQVFSLGLLLAWTYERSGSLAVPCVIHMLHNGLVLLMVASGWLET